MCSYCLLHISAIPGNGYCVFAARQPYVCTGVGVFEIIWLDIEWVCVYQYKQIASCLCACILYTDRVKAVCMNLATVTASGLATMLLHNKGSAL